MSFRLLNFAVGMLFAVLTHLALTTPVFAADAVNRDDPKMQETIDTDSTMAAKTGTAVDCVNCIKDHTARNFIDGSWIEPAGKTVETPEATDSKVTH